MLENGRFSRLDEEVTVKRLLPRSPFFQSSILLRDLLPKDLSFFRFFVKLHVIFLRSLLRFFASFVCRTSWLCENDIFVAAISSAKRTPLVEKVKNFREGEAHFNSVHRGEAHLYSYPSMAVVRRWFIFMAEMKSYEKLICDEFHPTTFLHQSTQMRQKQCRIKK